MPIENGSSIKDRLATVDELIKVQMRNSEKIDFRVRRV